MSYGVLEHFRDARDWVRHDNGLPMTWDSSSEAQRWIDHHGDPTQMTVTEIEE
jgi:hypothetical protein